MGKARWFLETRPQFLLLAVLLVAHGGALAFAAGSFDLVRFLLAMVGLVVLSSGQALGLGIGTLVAGCAIGVYLAYVSGWAVIGVIGIVGALSVVLYTPLLTRLGLGEFFAGLSLGTLPVVGVYYLLTGRIDTAAWVSSIPAGLLTYNLLLLNEFPDAAADAAGGRQHMVVLMGKRNARWLYSAVEAGAFLAIVVGVAFGTLPLWALLGLGAAFFGFQAIRTAMREYDSFEGLIPAQGANVIAVLGMNALLAIGYLIAGLTRV
jgi:1,4-dihydroxy-2-naphthoate octaprenyltransferase